MRSKCPTNVKKERGEEKSERREERRAKRDERREQGAPQGRLQRVWGKTVQMYRGGGRGILRCEEYYDFLNFRCFGSRSASKYEKLENRGSLENQRFSIK